MEEHSSDQGERGMVSNILKGPLDVIAEVISFLTPNALSPLLAIQR